MNTPDVTKVGVIALLGTVLSIATVLGSPEFGLGDTPIWMRLAIAAALYLGYMVSHLISDAIIRKGRSAAVAAQHLEAAAQVQAGHRDGDDSIVPAGPVAD